ncbi:hypothetical protein Pint_00874 [Pistacia integerrima]|uniref:Uncharacterized protein n=1 Tax=Pistacia integerrima TaxID=434235 RepID=A0ACC0ZHH8_9ROSI|nr:hypothetical protein Pint_00874 [Pistacia integerrima]
MVVFFALTIFCFLLKPAISWKKTYPYVILQILKKDKYNEKSCLKFIFVCFLRVYNFKCLCCVFQYKDNRHKQLAVKVQLPRR